MASGVLGDLTAATRGRRRARSARDRPASPTPSPIALQQNPDALTSESEVHGAEADRADVRGGFGPKLHVDANVQQWNSPFDINFGGARLHGPQRLHLDRQRVAHPAAHAALVDLRPVQGAGPRRRRRGTQAQGHPPRGRLPGHAGVLPPARSAAPGRGRADAPSPSSRRSSARRSRSSTTASSARTTCCARRSPWPTRSSGPSRCAATSSSRAGSSTRSWASRPGRAVRARAVHGRAPARGRAERRVRRGRAPRPAPRDARARSEHRAGGSRRVGREEEAHPAGQRRRQLHAHRRLASSSRRTRPTSGLFASWDVWDWGTTTSGISSANAKLEQARIARKKLDDQVRLEARQAFVNAETAREALGVARTAVSQAEENFRIVTKKFENAAATSFDVVDAESLLTQARGQVETGPLRLPHREGGSRARHGGAAPRVTLGARRAEARHPAKRMPAGAPRGAVLWLDAACLPRPSRSPGRGLCRRSASARRRSSANRADRPPRRGPPRRGAAAHLRRREPTPPLVVGRRARSCSRHAQSTAAARASAASRSSESSRARLRSWRRESPAFLPGDRDVVYAASPPCPKRPRAPRRARHRRRASTSSARRRTGRPRQADRQPRVRRRARRLRQDRRDRLHLDARRRPRSLPDGCRRRSRRAPHVDRRLRRRRACSTPTARTSRGTRGTPGARSSRSTRSSSPTTSFAPPSLELWVANADGTDARQVTYLDAKSSGPSWYPADKRLLFASTFGGESARDVDLWAIDIDGTNLERVTHGARARRRPRVLARRQVGRVLVGARHAARPERHEHLRRAAGPACWRHVEERPADHLHGRLRVAGGPRARGAGPRHEGAGRCRGVHRALVRVVRPRAGEATRATGNRST